MHLLDVPALAGICGAGDKSVLYRGDVIHGHRFIRPGKGQREAAVATDVLGEKSKAHLAPAFGGSARFVDGIDIPLEAAASERAAAELHALVLGLFDLARLAPHDLRGHEVFNRHLLQIFGGFLGLGQGKAEALFAVEPVSHEQHGHDERLARPDTARDEELDHCAGVR